MPVCKEIELSNLPAEKILIHSSKKKTSLKCFSDYVHYLRSPFKMVTILMGSSFLMFHSNKKQCFAHYWINIRKKNINLKSDQLVKLRSTR